MRILFAAPEAAWDGFLTAIRRQLPQCRFEAAGRFEVADLKGFDVVMPTMTTIDRRVLETADQLRLIQQCGSGIEGIDLKAARRLGIPVANVPTDISGNADSVAELGIFLMIGLARQYPTLAKNMARRKISRPFGTTLNGKTVGLVGLGGIGKAMIRRLRPFGVNLIGIRRHDPHEARNELGLNWSGGPEELPRLLELSDYAVLCLPLTQETRNLMNADTFARMKPGAFLINLSRGGIVERDALEDALKNGTVAGAGLDVFWEEPPDPEDPIFRYNVLATPHVGGVTDISSEGIRKVVTENILRVAEGRKPLYVRNLNGKPG